MNFCFFCFLFIFLPFCGDVFPPVKINGRIIYLEMYMYIDYHMLSSFLLMYMYLFISIFILKFHFFLANILCKEFLLLRFISHGIKEFFLDGDGKLGLAFWQYVTGPSDEGYEGGLKAKPWKHDINTSLYSVCPSVSLSLCLSLSSRTSRFFCHGGGLLRLVGMWFSRLWRRVGSCSTWETRSQLDLKSQKGRVQNTKLMKFNDI